MPTLPLFDPSPAATYAPHAIQAPGGYEVWRFVAHDPASRTWITASFHQGFPSHQYLRRYLRFRRWPTRFIPPSPQDYLGVRVWIRSRDSHIFSSLQFGPTNAENPDNAVVQIAPNRFFQALPAGMHVRSTGIDLLFHPRYSHQPLESDTTSKPAKGETHRWLLSDGLCDVNGTIQIGETKLPFAGTGLHDQQYGTAPLLRTRFSGHLILEDKAMAFQAADQMHVATANMDALSVESQPAQNFPRIRTIWGLSAPRQLKLKNQVLLWNPKIIASSAMRAVIAYDADWQGERTIAVCEIDAAHRVGWPIVGNIIELGSSETR